MRCVFVVDDEGMLKAKAWPPRWKPGDKLIQPPPLTVSGAEKRVADKTLDVTDWQFVRNSL